LLLDLSLYMYMYMWYALPSSDPDSSSRIATHLHALAVVSLLATSEAGLGFEGELLRCATPCEASVGRLPDAAAASDACPSSGTALCAARLRHPQSVPQASQSRVRSASQPHTKVKADSSSCRCCRPSSLTPSSRRYEVRLQLPADVCVCCIGHRS
jgi:hypothetical protein